MDLREELQQGNRSVFSRILQEKIRQRLSQGEQTMLFLNRRGYAGFVMPRSGLAVKHGISIVNTPGLIDSDYRGELKVTLINLDPKDTFQAQKGDRIAQLVIMKVENANFECRDSLDETERGDSGFGSSGVQS